MELLLGALRGRLCGRGIVLDDSGGEFVFCFTVLSKVSSGFTKSKLCTVLNNVPNGGGRSNAPDPCRQEMRKWLEPSISIPHGDERAISGLVQMSRARSGSHRRVAWHDTLPGLF